MSAQEQISPAGENSERVVSLARLVKRLHTSNRIASVILLVVTALVTLAFVGVLAKVLIDGLPFAINPDFYGRMGSGTIGRYLFETFYMLILAEIILIPIALAAAIYLVEYARQGPLVTIIHFAAETLAGVPSIVLGLFGYLLFCSTFGWGFSRLAGALTLLCLNFPQALRLFEDALTSVPREQREGSLALGAVKWYTIRTVVLPSALPGIITGIVLSAGKVVGEAAALIFTTGSSAPSAVTLDPFASSSTLTTNIWYLQTVGGGLTKPVADAVSAGSGALLVVILLVLNIVARAIGRGLQRYLTAA
jgi:phosphate transport system permease protein